MGMTLGVSALAVLVYVFLQWVGSVIYRDASIVDRFWGFGFAVVAWAALLYNGIFDTKTWLVVALATIWGARLSIYLTWRNWGHGEDYRYVAMRERQGGKFWWTSFYRVFLLQGFLTWFIGLPLQRTMTVGGDLGMLAYIGVALWCVGLTFEAVGDWQLARFKSDSGNKGKVMDRGLWRYTRHPNYFGDAVLWWGMYLVAFTGPVDLLLAICPLTMTFFLMRVSGVPLLEKKLKKTRPEYTAYVERTSSFFPRPPRKLSPE